jgi:hypothetical protein
VRDKRGEGGDKRGGEYNEEGLSPILVILSSSERCKTCRRHILDSDSEVSCAVTIQLNAGGHMIVSTKRCDGFNHYLSIPKKC